jgi:hypothetical protein
MQAATFPRKSGGRSVRNRSIRERIIPLVRYRFFPEKTRATRTRNTATGEMPFSLMITIYYTPFAPANVEFLY